MYVDEKFCTHVGNGKGGLLVDSLANTLSQIWMSFLNSLEYYVEKITTLKGLKVYSTFAFTIYHFFYWVLHRIISNLNMWLLNIFPTPNKSLCLGFENMSGHFLTVSKNIFLKVLKRGEKKGGKKGGKGGGELKKNSFVQFYKIKL